MSLRTRLLALFAVVAVVPLCALGLVNHVQAMRALERLLAAQTQAIAERAAREMADRYALQRSDLLLLAENLETQRLLRAADGRDPGALRAARAAAEPYLEQLWTQFSPSYHAIELRDGRGAALVRLGDAAADADAALSAPGAPPRLVFEQKITDGVSGAPLGKVVAWPRAEQLLPAEVLESTFGSAGYSLVVERATGRVLYQPRRAHLPGSTPEALRAGGAALDEGSGSVRFRERDSLRVASFVGLEEPAWSVLSTSAVEEFAPPFRRMRTTSLLLLAMVTISVSVAFVLAIRRETRSLAALTRAADAVGRGDLAPPLPPAGRDEVGRLSAAFGIMTAKVGEMMAQIERSRQMAAIGEFAAEIAHEIRNPLTSVKLNLQRLERRVRAMPAPAELAGPLEISLREISRLERVVRGVLHLGRPRALARAPCSLHTALREAIETVRVLAERQEVRIELDLAAGSDRVRGDAEQLTAALLNLLLNAVEAMPAGGLLHVSTRVAERGEDPDAIVVRIADTGPGIPAAQREHLFRPFHTTKPNGTGLGLAMTLRTVEEHGGTILLEPERSEPAGAVFRVELPLALEGVPA